MWPLLQECRGVFISTCVLVVHLSQSQGNSTAVHCISHGVYTCMYNKL